MVSRSLPMNLNRTLANIRFEQARVLQEIAGDVAFHEQLACCAHRLPPFVIIDSNSLMRGPSS